MKIAALLISAGGALTAVDSWVGVLTLAVGFAVHALKAGQSYGRMEAMLTSLQTRLERVEDRLLTYITRDEESRVRRAERLQKRLDKLRDSR